MSLTRRRLVVSFAALSVGGVGIALSTPKGALAQEWVDPGPGRWQAGALEVVISLGPQRPWAYEGEAYRVEDVPYVMDFTNEGHARHGTYWHDNFGTPLSHGCVNLPMDVADWMYRRAPEGTGVTVIA